MYTLGTKLGNPWAKGPGCPQTARPLNRLLWHLGAGGNFRSRQKWKVCRREEGCGIKRISQIGLSSLSPYSDI